MPINVTMTCWLTLTHQTSGSVVNITALAEIAKHIVPVQFLSDNVIRYISCSSVLFGTTGAD